MINVQVEHNNNYNFDDVNNRANKKAINMLIYNKIKK
jgi:hypothetical protein